VKPEAPRVGKQPTPAEKHTAHKACQAPHQPSPDTPLSKLFEQPNHLTTNPFANAVIDPITGKSMEYRALINDPTTQKDWLHSAANEFGRCAQGVGNRIKGTNTITFIPKHEVPADRKVTYARFVCTLRPQKTEVRRTRLTVGGNLIDYPGDTSAPTADITTAKCLINSVLSTPNAKMACGDIKNFYLNTPMDRPEYMRIPINLIPPEITTEYNLHAIQHNDHVYVRINKGMYGLPQAGKLANDLLEKRLSKHGWYQCRHTPGLWRHANKPIKFALVVDDLAIHYTDKAHIDELIHTLRQSYEGVSVDWSASLYCGITMKWNYQRRTCEISMPGYIAATLQKFKHVSPARPQHSPHRSNAPQYGTKVQLTDPIDTSPCLPDQAIQRIQQIVGTLLYYSRAVDNTLLVALSALASEQSVATTRTNQSITQLLDYCHTHPNATVTFTASDMKLHIHSDAGYLNETKARSRAGGHFYLGNTNDDTFRNGAILNPTGILRHVASSASEAEYGALFVNSKEGTILRQTLHNLGHPQSTTPIRTDNSTADGIANDTIKQQRSRAIDMRYHWVRDRVQQKHFNVYWAPGSTNLADYFTKHFSAAHHKRNRSQYLSHAARYCPTRPTTSSATPKWPYARPNFLDNRYPKPNSHSHFNLNYHFKRNP
jgi:hypothetical protein